MGNEAELKQQLIGRAEFLEAKGEVKTPTLLRQAALALMERMEKAERECDLYRAALQDDERPMESDSDEMTAAESVLAYLYVEIVGAPDDEAVSPLKAQKAIEAKLSSAKAERDAAIARAERAERLLEEAIKALPVTQAESDILQERSRQVSEEGWTAEHDDAHRDFSMAKAACIYAVGATLDGPDRAVMDTHGTDGTPGWMKELWPWDIKWWKPTGRRRDLVKAAALIIAEIERLDRAARAIVNKEGGE